MIDRDARSPASEPVRSARQRIDDDGWTGLVVGAAFVAMALVTGLIFAFSAAVMPNLADADDRTFVSTMQRFNRNPVFSLSFTAALALTIIAVVMQRRHGHDEAVRWTVAALVLYGIVVAVTAVIHIPLNYDIDQAGDPDRVADLAGVRNDFETRWTVWNVVRTVFSIAAVAALARALLLDGRSTRGRSARRNAGPRAATLSAPHPHPADLARQR